MTAGVSTQLLKRVLPDDTAAARCGCLQSNQGPLQGGLAAIDPVPPVCSPPCEPARPRCLATSQRLATAPTGAQRLCPMLTHRGCNLKAC